MSTAVIPAVTVQDSDRRRALLDSLDGLLGCTRAQEIRHRLQRAESQAADLRAIDCPLGGRKHRGQTLYGEMIATLEQQAADLRAIDCPLGGRKHRGQTLYGEMIATLEQQAADLSAILEAAQARDEQDRYAHLASCLLQQALDELMLAVQAGTLTQEAALVLVQQAGQAVDAMRAADEILDAIDAAESPPPAAI